MSIFDKKYKVDVELYDLELTDKKGDHLGRVAPTGLLKEDDLIRIAAARRADLSPETLRASMDVLKEVATESLFTGATVGLGLGFFYLEAEGVFMGSQAKWDAEKHSLKVKSAPSAHLQNLAREDTQVNVQGMSSGPIIHSILDEASGKENAHLTGNKTVTITGSRIKIMGDHAVCGVTFAYAHKDGFFRLPSTEMLVNEHSKLAFVMPPLPAGAYWVSVTTTYCSANRMHKEPCTCTFHYPLTLSWEV
ncbi:MAG: DUF4469 domain-containing protein [Prevotellaceae bacterium]|jgi:hypothetical protein|nr:DUF4469 domain-containing protein [Prevotellaceae bacterium]